LIATITIIGFGIVLPLLFLTGNHANASKQVGGIKLTAAEKHGREIFGHNCAFCHTLAAANASGKVGPNLDQLRPSEQVVLNTIKNGCLQNPPSTSSPQACLGYGTMPAGIVQGQDAKAVAAFVAAVAGQE
jgi:mono/diheme cytochrome c family protein